MEKLTKGKWLQHPAAKPPRTIPLPSAFSAPDEALGLTHVPGIFERTEGRIDGNSHAHLLGRINAQSETSERRTDGRSVGRRQGRGSPGIAHAERLDLRVK